MNLPYNDEQDINKAVEELSFEEAFSELENIVVSLETGEQTLEEALAMYERGQALARHCTSLLDQAELKVKQLSGETLLEFPEEDLPF